MDDDDDFVKLLEGSPENLHKDLESITPSESRVRSNADDVIDAVGNLVQKRAKISCPKCGNKHLTTRRPLSGGVTIYFCTSCAFKFEGPSISPVRLYDEAKRSAEGPYYKPSKKLNKQDKHSPKYRNKGKPLSSFKKED